MLYVSPRRVVAQCAQCQAAAVIAEVSCIIASCGYEADIAALSAGAGLYTGAGAVGDAAKCGDIISSEAAGK